MRRVVVTGLGVVSSIGNQANEVLTSLVQSRSGLVFMPELLNWGLKCGVYGPIKDWDDRSLGKKERQMMSTISQYGTSATLEAIQCSGLQMDQLRNERTGIVVGTSFSGVNEVFRIEELLLKGKSPSRAGVTGIVKIMNSSTSGNLAAYLGIKGRVYSLSSSFASGTDNIGHAYELIKYGLQDVCICGSAEEDCWKQLGGYFDNWDAMPTSWNDNPTAACRPYDRDRQGFVMSSGAGILIVETLEHALQRGADIYAEIIGYGSSNDGADMFRPSGKGLKRSMQQALSSAYGFGAERIDYLNGHGTGTPLGDRTEVQAIKDVFMESAPPLSSTKALTGHGLGAAGAQEVVYVLLMLHHKFIAPTVNLKNVAKDCSGVPHVQSFEKKKLETVMNINVGLGGSTSALILKKF